ncbi:MAG: hypothetical protein PHF86_03275 [Candidatus Nanoarchaeia archaeon]|nr:hypothetical protein [Candidatus Nanoarchaeia archaeon]
MAVLFVTFLVIVVVLIFGLVEKLFCSVFPFLKYVKYVGMVVLWPVVVYMLMKELGTSEIVEQFVAVCMYTAIYWVMVVAIKFVLVPVTMLFDLFKIAKSPDIREGSYRV